MKFSESQIDWQNQSDFYLPLKIEKHTDWARSGLAVLLQHYVSMLTYSIHDRKYEFTGEERTVNFRPLIRASASGPKDSITNYVMYTATVSFSSSEFLTRVVAHTTHAELLRTDFIFMNEVFLVMPWSRPDFLPKSSPRCRWSISQSFSLAVSALPAYTDETPFYQKTCSAGRSRKSQPLASHGCWAVVDEDPSREEETEWQQCEVLNQQSIWIVKRQEEWPG